MRIGIDLGGTKIEGVALDEGGAELARRRIDTPSGDYAATLQAVSDLVIDLETVTGLRGTVGVGTPGAISPASGLIKNSNSVCLNGKPLDRDLARVLGRHVRLANDANCFALSEATDGAAAGDAVVFGVILGTGTGGGIVVRGQLLPGLNAIAGEWGHNPLPWPNEDERPGPVCYCGKSGCIETFLSGPGMSRDHTAVTGVKLSAADIAAKAAQDDVECMTTIHRYEERLARALAGVINILDPDTIVLGGGLSKVEHIYQEVPRLWGKYVFSDRVDTRLARARYGDASGVRGAAWLWDR